MPREDTNIGRDRAGTVLFTVTRGPPELVQHFRLKGEFTCPKFDMVWLNRSSYPMGEEGGNFLVQMISTCLPSGRERGWGSAPCGMTLAFGLIGPFCGSAAGQSVANAATRCATW